MMKRRNNYDNMMMMKKTIIILLLQLVIVLVIPSLMSMKGLKVSAFEIRQTSIVKPSDVTHRHHNWSLYTTPATAAKPASGTELAAYSGLSRFIARLRVGDQRSITASICSWTAAAASSEFPSFPWPSGDRYA